MILVGVATDDASVALLLVMIINVLLYDEHYGVVAVVFTYSGLVRE